MNWKKIIRKLFCGSKIQELKSENRDLKQVIKDVSEEKVL